MWVGHCGDAVFFCFAPEVAPIGMLFCFQSEIMRRRSDFDAQGRDSQGNERNLLSIVANWIDQVYFGSICLGRVG